MKTKSLSSYIVALLMVFALLSTSCKKNNTDPVVPPVKVTGLQLTTNAKLGAIITDNTGKSVYFFSKDAAATSACVGACAVTWPPFYQATPTMGTGLSSADFGTITRTDGTMQTTYKGWPLYYYSLDVNAGDTNGDAFANFWAIAKADYSVMFSNAQLIGLDGAQYTDQGVAGTAVSQYLTDPAGHTLYMFSKDTHNTNIFTKADLSNNTVWPMDEVAAVGSIPTVFDKTLFTTITVFGKTQLVFKGHPLYQFGQDAATRGNTKGVSFPTPGSAIWKITNNNTVAL
jgi:predicted lipoprotein with Yx(FWY)xxD motif